MRPQDTRTVVDAARFTPADALDDITRLTRELEEARAECARLREELAQFHTLAQEVRDAGPWGPYREDTAWLQRLAALAPKEEKPWVTR